MEIKQPSGQYPSQPQSRRKLSQGTFAILAIILIAALVGLVSGLYNRVLIPSVSWEGGLIDHLFDILLGISVFIFIIVNGTLIYVLLRFGRPAQSAPGVPDTPEKPWLHIVWTVIPIGIVAFLGAYSYIILMNINQPRPNEMTIEVTAKQWEWQFYYPDAKVTSTVLHLPVDRQVLLHLHSLDVIHSLWVPAFRVKEDVMPDRFTELVITPTQLGTFPLLCNRICGVGHAVMRTTVVVQSEADYETWLKATAAKATPSATVSATAAP